MDAQKKKKMYVLQQGWESQGNSQYIVRYVAHANNNIMIRFCNNQYNTKQLYNDTLGYLTEEYKMQTLHT